MIEIFQIEAKQITRFYDVLFLYADVGTYASCRTFYDDGNGCFEICAVKIDKGLSPIAKILAAARRATQSPRATVFCPPIATFTNSQGATENDLANGLALSVECDQNPQKARRILERLLGKATLVIRSGGEWINPETGEVEDKLHLHWRLKTPTRDSTAHALLKKARTHATALVGGDASNKPIVHPIRWAGSWHRKKTPRLTQIIAETSCEIELSQAVELLDEALAAVGIGINDDKQKSSGNADTSTGEARDTAALVAEITSGHDYHVPITALAMRYLLGGMADSQTVVTLRGLMLSVPENIRDIKDGVLQSGRWQARYGEIPRAVKTARDKISKTEWADPQPIQATLPPVLPFDAEKLLPPVLRDWIMDEANRKPCPPDYIAAAVVVALGAVIGARCAIKPKSKDDWLIVPNLWGGIVGQPSAKKSPAISAALKPLERLVAQAVTTHKMAVGFAEADNIVHAARKDAITKRIKDAATDKQPSRKGKTQ